MKQLHFVTGVGSEERCFGHEIGRRLRLACVDVVKNKEEPSRLESRVVCEITVDSGEQTFHAALEKDG